MELKRKRVMVIGLGVSGSAAARFLATREAALVMTDQRTDLTGANLPAGEIHLGAEDPAWLDGVELIVVSPGVPASSRLVTAARTAQIPLIGELELGFRFVRAPIVAVTGTNGKSTVTTLLGEIFTSAGLRTFVGGNLGTPLVEAAGADYDVMVVEVSSYQLETIERFKPHVAVHLNLTEDHLDRYRDFAAYGAAKARIFANQEAGDWAILNRDDPAVWRLADQAPARVMSFGLQRPSQTPAVWRQGDRLAYDDGATRGSLGLAGLQLPGTHNCLNAMAAVAAARAMSIAPEVIERALARFTGLPHRVEMVREKNGVHYVDDSKGTNVGAVIEALAAMPPPVILIAGGVDKGGDYGPLRTALQDKVKLLLLIGAARAKMQAELAGATTIELAATLADAVAAAAARARPGDTVLLSPACSSFDQFKDYAERGRVFQELVQAL